MKILEEFEYNIRIVCSVAATNPEILEIFGIDIDNLGEGIQALLAGDIPDVPVNGIYVENTCNN